MRVLIIYYTRTGANEKICRELQNALNCEMEQIVDRINRRGILNFFLAGRDALLKKLTKIDPIKSDPGHFDLVIVGTPLWVGTLPPATRTFLKEYKDRLKRMAAISVSAMGKGNKNALKELETASGKKVNPGLLLREKDIKTGTYKTELESFIENIQVLQKVKGDLRGN